MVAIFEQFSFYLVSYYILRKFTKFQSIREKARRVIYKNICGQNRIVSITVKSKRSYEPPRPTTTYQDLPQATTCHYELPRATTSNHEPPRATKSPKTLTNTSHPTKKLSTRITMSQTLRKITNHEPKIDISRPWLFFY